MRKNIFTLALLAVMVCSAVSLKAQQAYNHCSTMQHLHDLELQDPDLTNRMNAIEQQTAAYLQSHPNASRAVVTIPVVVHVVYNTSTQNISDALIQAQINQLNLDFARLNSDASSTPSVFASVAANTNVQFCLAQRDPNGNATTGIVRKSTTTTSFIDNDRVKSSSTGGDNAWPAANYLNLWVCNLGNNLLGYAQFPGGSASTDGVVVLYSSVGSMTTPGTAAPYNFGRTATHEIGHWLNLRHIWGDDSNCNGSDLVGDTPNQNTENYGCPSYPLTDACSPSAPGVMFMNYMDYTDDGCMNMFTAGQTSRMQALFATGGARIGLVSSLGCTPPSTSTCNAPTGLSTTNVANTSATFNWAAVTNAVSYTVQYRVSGASTWTSAGASATSYNATGLTAGTGYEWQVSTVCSSGSSAFTLSSTFTTTGGTACTDAFESNNTSGTAKTPALNATVTGLITPSTDVDWFKFTTTSPNTKIRVDLTNLPADYDMILYKSNASTKLGTSANGSTTAEVIKYNTSSSGTYYLKVYGYNGATSASQCYSLKISTSSSNFRTTGDEEEGISTKEIIAEEVPLLKLYPNPAQDNLNIEFMSEANAQATVSVFDMTGRKVLGIEKETTEGINLLNLNTANLVKGNYIFQIQNNGETLHQRFVIVK
jgi:hypothetical protein